MMWAYTDDIAPKEFTNRAEVSYDNDTLDLRDIVLLLNYERATTEPRFRYTKLTEVAKSGCDFKELAPFTRQVPQWREATVPRTGFVFLLEFLPEGAPEPRWVEPIRATGSNATRFYKVPFDGLHLLIPEKVDGLPTAEGANESSTSESANEPDTPDNMLPTPVPPHLQDITPKALETYYWQARNYDGCFPSALIFQHFIDLFSPGPTKIRVRVVHKTDGAREYTTFAGSRSIIDMTLSGSKTITLSAILDLSKFFGRMCLNDYDPSAFHVVLGFSESSVYGEVDTVLDMSSLQFGDVGRGDKGRSLFVLEPKDQYVSRLAKFAHRNNFATAKHKYRLSDNVSNNDWFLDIARRAKDRWDNRANIPWCGHCGAPPRGGKQLQRCYTCKAAYFCNTEHQYAAWKHHKHFCKTSKASSSAGPDNFTRGPSPATS